MLRQIESALRSQDQWLKESRLTIMWDENQGFVPRKILGVKRCFIRRIYLNQAPVRQGIPLFRQAMCGFVI